VPGFEKLKIDKRRIEKALKEVTAKMCSLRKTKMYLMKIKKEYAD
jgi:hypothetical protein